MAGYTYHLTQRCHNRQFLLRFARDRDAYREWLRDGVQRFGVPVYGYCITSNHVHILAHVDTVESVSQLMHLASGSTAKQYNLRKERTGSMWQHPYHCTMIEDGRHLMNCLTYIDLNMVRAGKVAHPREWRWCGHDELLGKRKRYRLLNIERLLESLGLTSADALVKWYSETTNQHIADSRITRESIWTESFAVGSEPFVEKATHLHSNRWTYDIQEHTTSDEQVWAVRESSDAYSAISS